MLDDGLKLAFFNDGIDDVTQHCGNGAAGFNVNGELCYDFALAQPLRRNLYHVVLKHIQSGGLCVEDYQIPLLIGINEALQDCLPSIAHEVGRQQPVLAQLMNKLPAAGRGLTHFHALHDT